MEPKSIALLRRNGFQILECDMDRSIKGQRYMITVRWFKDMGYWLHAPSQNGSLGTWMFRFTNTSLN